MKTTILRAVVLAAMVLLPCAGRLGAAMVEAVTGYTNDFSSRPLAADWSTRFFGTSTGSSAAGEVTTVAELDAAVQTNLAAAITTQCGSASGTPPSGASTAVWASGGGYLQTRPTQCAATLLMATFINNTGTNATTLRVRYDYTTNRASLATEEVRGHRVYYSLWGIANGWSNIADLSQTAQTNLSLDLTLAEPWTNGSKLYLLWADDNGSSSPDDALDLDNFSLTVLSGGAPPASCNLTAPANGQALSAPASVVLSASASPGPDATLTGVGFYDLATGFLGSDWVAPYSVSVNLAAGIYRIYAVATNSLEAVLFSSTNTLTLTNLPLGVVLNSPGNGQSFAESVSLSATATVAGGAPPYTYSVTFYTNTVGETVGSLEATGAFPSFAAALGTLPQGTYQIYAQATDGVAVARSITNTFTVEGAIKVPPAGITLTFDTAPAVQKWSTFSVPGTPTAIQSYADMDASMATNGAANISAALSTQSGGTTSSSAYWRSSDQKLGTQPTGNRETLLMATLVNDTGVTVAALDISYTFGLASITPSETNKGHRLYYSTTGATNSWTPLGFFALASLGSSPVACTVTGLSWMAGAKLYLVWLDDNGTNPDGDYTIDNVSFQPRLAVLNASLTSPANGQVFLQGQEISATAAVASGDAPYLVTLYTNSGLGNPLFAPAGAPLSDAPFTLNLGALSLGLYNLYAEVTDRAGAGTTARSVTNSFSVAAPLAIALTAPPDGASFDWLVSLGATGAVSGGTAPYTVRFFTNSVLVGTADGSDGPFFFKNLGSLFLGHHTVQATVTDAKGWTNSSAVHHLTITGPLMASLLPTNGASFNYGQFITLTGLVVGGTAPYGAAFYTNGQMAALAGPGDSPLTLALGLLPVGSYSNTLLAIDDDGAVAQTATNLLTIRPNPLTVALSAPTAGQLFRGTQPVTVTALPSVGTPLTIGSVEFFLDGVSLGTDPLAPYTTNLTGLADGSHVLYAVAMDSLGRLAVSVTNSFQVLNLPAGVLVGPAGYTTGFDTQPPASEWSTRSFGSGGMGTADIATAGALDAAVQTNAAAAITNQCTSSTANPPSSAATATWSTTGYLQTRPTQVSAILLMGTFVNTTGTNATRVRLAYDYTTNRAGLVAEEVRGQRVYYSLTGATNSWVLIPELSQTNQGALSADVTLGGTWTNRGVLFLLWADANGSGSPDDANDLDNLSVGVTGGTPVTPPLSVALTTPPNGAAFQAPASLALAAEISGQPEPTNVLFLANGTVVGSAAASPYLALWSNVPSALYRLSAVACNANGSYTSAPVSLTVTNLWAGSYLLVDAEEVWKYLDDGSAPDSGWNLPAFDDGAWWQGNAALGYGTSGLGTLIRSNRADSARIITTFFRHAFVVPDHPAAYTYLLTKLLVDDGAVVYLNGVEIFRHNLPEGPVDSQTLAVSNVPPAGELVTLQLRPDLLRTGTNLLAIEMHLAATNAADLLCSLELEAVVTNAPPSVAISSPLNGTTLFLSAPTNLPIAATASDPDGLVADVEFYLSGDLLGHAGTSPFGLVWSNAFRNGTYYLAAVATDAQGLRSTSALVSVTLICTVPPSVSLTSPPDGAEFFGPTNLTLVATVLENGGLVTNVTFYRDGSIPLGQATERPFALTWSNVPLGYYALTAVATDDGGLSSLSGVVHLAVHSPVLRLTSPAPGAVFVAPADIPITVVATNLPLTNVTLWLNGVRWLESAAPPYAWQWSSAPVGLYSLTAVGIDQGGNAFTSAPVSLAVVPNTPPTVALTAPTNNSTFISPSSLTLLASAFDDNGIAKVEFLADGIRLGETTFSPYSFIWSNPPVGPHVLTAVATDFYGITNQSAPVTIAIATTPVTRGPYLNSRGSSSIVVRWRTQSATDSRVWYGLSPGALTATADDATLTTEHKVTLGSLLSETKYYYAIGNAAGPIITDTNFYFATAPVPGASRPTRIWFLSDYGQVNSTQSTVRDTYLSYLSATGRGTDLWLTGGDNEQSGLTGADSAYQTSVFNVYSNILRNTPIFPCPGNHDGGSSSAYWSIFDLPDEGQAGGLASSNAHYYSFDYGNIHFISLDAFNASVAVGSPMLVWLTNDLASTTQPWIIAYWHAPPYCKVFYDSDSASPLVEMRQNFNPVLESYGVDLVLNGHSHSLQRTYLINGHYGLSTTFGPGYQVDAGSGRPDGTGAYLKAGRQGTVYCVAPTGCGFTRSGSTTHPACFLTLNDTAGFLLIDVESNRLDFRCVTSAGAIGDYFTILKGASQGAPPAAPADLAATTNGSSALLAWSNNATNEMSYRLECSVNGAAFAETALLGANLTNYTHAGLDFSNAYYYRLRSWNNAGYSDYSALASLTPGGPLAIDRQPQSLTNQPGTTALFYVLARGTGPITYQWYRQGVLLAGETNRTLKLSNVQSVAAGSYTVVLSNGGTPLQSDAALLTVLGSAAQAPTLVAAPRLTNGVFAASFQGSPGLTYTIQTTEALGTSWQSWTNVTVPPDGLIFLQDETKTLRQRFYRLLYPPQ